MHASRTLNFVHNLRYIELLSIFLLLYWYPDKNDPTPSFQSDWNVRKSASPAVK